MKRSRSKSLLLFQWYKPSFYVQSLMKFINVFFQRNALYYLNFFQRMVQRISNRLSRRSIASGQDWRDLQHDSAGWKFVFIRWSGLWIFFVDVALVVVVVSSSVLKNNGYSKTFAVQVQLSFLLRIMMLLLLLLLFSCYCYYSSFDVFIVGALVAYSKIENKRRNLSLSFIFFEIAFLQLCLQVWGKQILLLIRLIVIVQWVVVTVLDQERLKVWRTYC